MQKAGTSAVSGCIVWLILISVLSTCLVPVALMVGGFTSFTRPVIQFTGRFLCPEGSQPERYSYSSTIIDDNGFTQPATAYELHCLDAHGKVVKSDPIVYSFLWSGILTALALSLAALFSFLLAAPAGIWIGKLLNRRARAIAPQTHLPI